MIKLIPGSKWLFIDDKCNLYMYNHESKEYELADIPIYERYYSDHTVEMVNIDIYGEKRTYDLHWLMRLAMTETFVKNAPDNVEFIDYKPVNSEKIWYRVKFKEPVYYTDGFRVIPGFSRYAIAKDGTIIQIDTGKKLSVTVRVSDYKYVCVYNPKINHTSDVALHVLLALAWVPNDSPDVKVEVNHKDGNKYNTVAANLEWVTHIENTQHAFKTGLCDRGSVRPVMRSITGYIVRDIYTGEETHVINFIEALKKMGLPLNITRLELLGVGSRSSTPIAGRYEVKIDGDERPWLFTKNDIDNNIVNISKGSLIITVTHKSTGETLRFDHIYAFRKHFKLWNMVLNEKNIPDIFNKLFPDYTIKVLNTIHKGSIQVKDIETGEVVEFTNGTRGLADFMGKAQSTVAATLYWNGSRAYRNSKNGKMYCYRWKSDAPWPKFLNCVTSKYNKTITSEGPTT